MKPGTPFLLLGAGLLATVAVRLAYLWSLAPTPWFSFLNVDPGFYDQWARQIAAGQWLGERAFYMDPLYPYLLGSLYALAGHGLLLPRLLNIAFAAGTCALVACQARALGGRRAMAVAALGFAFYAPDVFHTGEIDKTALSLLLVAGALALQLRTGWRAQLAGGAVLGLGILTRANLLAIVPLFAVLAWIDRPAARPGIAAFLAGVGLALAPATIHNAVVSGRFVLTTTQAGQNFYIGNCAENPQGGYGVLPFVRGAPPFEELDFRAEAERRTGHAMTPGEVSQFWFGASFAYIRAQPGVALAVLLRKVALFWNDFEIPDSTDQYLAASYSGVMRWPLLSFGMLLPWAAVGAVSTWRHPHGRRLVLFALCYAATTAAFFVMARYRLQVIAALWPLAASGVVGFVEHVQARERRRVAVAATVLASVSWFAWHQVDVFAVDSEVLVQQRYQHLAQIYEQAGDHERALRIRLDATRTCERFCRLSLEDLFAYYTASHRRNDGIVAFERFLRAHPGHPIAAGFLAQLQATPTTDP